jgi:hypothetical protein
MELVVETGLILNGYRAEPGSPSRDALSLLASWAATADHETDRESAGQQALSQRGRAVAPR